MFWTDRINHAFVGTAKKDAGAVRSTGENQASAVGCQPRETFDKFPDIQSQMFSDPVDLVVRESDQSSPSATSAAGHANIPIPSVRKGWIA